MLEDGFHRLPPGRLAVFTMYLRHALRDVRPATPLPAGFRLERLAGGDVERYRRLFRAVGEEWLWFGGLKLEAEALARLLDQPLHEAYALRDADGDCGIVELDFTTDEPELVYFGLLPRLMGKGLGRPMAEFAIHRAHETGAISLMVHTCSFDAPGALGFYQKMGFVPYANALEFFTDPRLDGTLPREAAAHVPLIEA